MSSSCAFSLASRSASFLRVSASRSASLMVRRACSSARPMVSAAMRLRFATHTANTSAAATSVTRRLSRRPYIGNTRDVLSLTHVGLGWVGAARGEAPRTDGKVPHPRGARPFISGGSEKAPLCRVGRSMNLRKQVEPLKKAALQASSLRGMHTTRHRDSLR